MGVGAEWRWGFLWGVHPRETVVYWVNDKPNPSPNSWKPN